MPKQYASLNGTVLKAGNPWLYVKLLIFTLLFCLVYWQIPGWSPVTLFLLTFLLMFASLVFLIPRLSKIIIHKHGFEKVAFVGKQNIKWDEISAADYRIKYHFIGRNTFMEIVLKNGVIYNLPLNYYSRSNIQKFANEMLKACPNAVISDKINNLALGKFPILF